MTSSGSCWVVTFSEPEADWTIITNPAFTFSRAPSSLDEPFKHFFSFPVFTLYTLKRQRTRISFGPQLISAQWSLLSNLTFRSWQAMATCVLDESRSMSYSVVFSTTWWLLENDTPSTVWTTTDVTVFYQLIVPELIHFHQSLKSSNILDLHTFSLTCSAVRK